MIRPAQTGGFTLIEAMIALVIASLAMIAVMRSVGTGFDASARAGRELAATELANNALAAALAGGAARKDRTTETLTDGFRRIVVVRPRADLVLRTTSLALTPYQVDVAVTWTESGQNRAVTLSTLRMGGTP